MVPGAVSAATTVDLPALFKRHNRVHLSFSGGRDSVVLADLCRPWHQQVVLVWANTGLMWPHMARFVREFSNTQGLRLLEARPRGSLREFWAREGVPVNILPYENAIGQARPRMQLWPNCCSWLRGAPVFDAIIADGGTAMLHGQRAADASPNKHHQSPGAFVAGLIECAGPIWDWSDEEVAAYVQNRELALPLQYQGHDGSSLECAYCPAFHGLRDRRATAALSRPLANISRAHGLGNIGVALVALQRLNGQLDAIPPEDRQARWAEAAPLIAEALNYDWLNRTVDQMRRAFLAGEYELFATGGSVLLAKCHDAGEDRILELCLAGGRLSELREELIPQAELFGIAAGCTMVTIGGRRGWIRALQPDGYTFGGKSEAKYSWFAIKRLAA
jgi:3'-phosphoadenosine 5'-phosphosulfate sulfotransferase (PAPS reductase)/FAD synthetase